MLPTEYELFGAFRDIEDELAKHGDPLRAALVCYGKMTGVEMHIDRDLGKSPQDRAAMILMWLCDAFIDGLEAENRLSRSAKRPSD